MVDMATGPYEFHLTDTGDKTTLVLSRKEQKTIRIPFGSLFIVILIIISIIIFGRVFVFSHPDVEELDSAPVGQSESALLDRPQNQNTYSPLENGCVFPESSNRYLTEEEIAGITDVGALSREEVLQYAINEIYARNHYSFETDYLNEYYSRFSWYVDEGLSMEESRALFNIYESYNADQLVIARDRG